MFYAVISTFGGVIGTYSAPSLEELKADLKKEHLIDTLDVGDTIKITEE